MLDAAVVAATSEALESALAFEDTCPKCLGALDTGWECVVCGYDAMPLVRPGESA